MTFIFIRDYWRCTDAYMLYHTHTAAWLLTMNLNFFLSLYSFQLYFRPLCIVSKPCLARCVSLWITEIAILISSDAPYEIFGVKFENCKEK